MRAPSGVSSMSSNAVQMVYDGLATRARLGRPPWRGRRHASGESGASRAGVKALDGLATLAKQFPGGGGEAADAFSAHRLFWN